MKLLGKIVKASHDGKEPKEFEYSAADDHDSEAIKLKINKMKTEVFKSASPPIDPKEKWTPSRSTTFVPSNNSVKKLSLLERQPSEGYPDNIQTYVEGVASATFMAKNNIRDPLITANLVRDFSRPNKSSQ